MKGKMIALILTGSIFLAGFASLTFPIWHGFILEHSLQEQMSSFLTFEHGLDPTEIIEENPLRTAVEEYNQVLFEQRQVNFNGKAAYETPSFLLADYGYESEIFGVLSIPEISLEMPVYLGANSENLAVGAAHLSQTSLPIGGINTNSVIAGHRGWKGAEFFKYIPNLHIGDEVTITNLWETLSYQVVEIKTIYSSNSEQLLIQPDRDLLTLLTCDYGEAGLKLRCLVICERING